MVDEVVRVGELDGDDEDREEVVAGDDEGVVVVVRVVVSVLSVPGEVNPVPGSPPGFW